MEFLSEIKERDELMKVLNVAIDRIYKNSYSNSTEIDLISKLYVEYCSNQLTKAELLEHFPDDLKDCVLTAIESRKERVSRHLLDLHNSSDIPLMNSFDWDIKFFVGNSSLAAYRQQKATLILNCQKGPETEIVTVELNRDMLDKMIVELEKESV